MQIASNNIAQYIIAIIVFDIFVGPAIPLLSIQASIFLCVFIVILNLSHILRKLKLPSIIFIIGVFTSTLYGLWVSPEMADGYPSVNVENIKRCGYLFLALAVYQATTLFCLKLNNNGRCLLARVLLFSCIFYIVFAVVFKYDYQLYESLKSYFFNVSVAVSHLEELVNAGYLSRYSFILLDPNNSGYYILMISIFIIENLDTEKPYKLIAWITTALAPFLCLSGGVIYTIVIYLLLKFLPAVKKSIFHVIRFNTVKKQIVPVVLAIIVAIFLAITFSQELFTVLENTDLLLRLLDSSYEQSTQNRFERYGIAFQQGFPNIIGSGYLIFIDGLVFKPHSDHLRFLYSYGFITYISLFFMFLKKDIIKKEYLFLIPAIAAFTFNSLIDETRVLFTFALLFALANSKQFQIQNR